MFPIRRDEVPRDRRSGWIGHHAGARSHAHFVCGIFLACRHFAPGTTCAGLHESDGGHRDVRARRSCCVPSHVPWYSPHQESFRVPRVSLESLLTFAAAHAGQVYAEARIPHCADRGIGALWDGDARSTPRTVHHPCPACTTSSSDSLVEVDSPLLGMAPDIPAAPQPLACAPARATFEGDNLLIVPAYRSVCTRPLCSVCTGCGQYLTHFCIPARVGVWWASGCRLP